MCDGPHACFDQQEASHEGAAVATLQQPEQHKYAATGYLQTASRYTSNEYWRQVVCQQRQNQAQSLHQPEFSSQSLHHVPNEAGTTKLEKIQGCPWFAQMRGASEY